MEQVAFIPPLLAVLNTTAAGLVGGGYYFIRRRERNAHRSCMIAALVVSTVFMVFYLYYHAQVGNVPFAGAGAIRPVYFTILASHVILAAILLPMVLLTVTLALRHRTCPHRRIARWTLPIWLYVSVTGVVVYLLAFHVYPSAQ